ncbi:CTQ-dependent lysine 6-oxidase LodA [Salsipaludibacter albus]|uniref:CTQ-dependent lysine 6-oxidase LodA n=1 Tax=Salsipaludibacter albus TaxID=2849650 RepID=UPI001EE4B232|nr:CTQ-dependent lysine 6-oxidase LodA [Salsipaludibacter albus]MBY5163622.1 CTQ-dependent lysine 6-oxidase LodA [Salsipaludibacter albus]
MATHRIHPSIGVARLGNSPDEFYLAPEAVGGLPIACDAAGNPVLDDDGEVTFVEQFKDGVGRIKRQAARFRVFADTDDGPQPVELGDEVERITWTVHIANKKPIWFTFSELQGDLEFGPDNSYANQDIPVNNSDVAGDARKALMIDPGPRSIERPGDVVEMSSSTIPSSYRFGSFPPRSSGGTPITTLGELRMDEAGNLVALGGFGNVAGSGDITSFRGASGYHDDIADGVVLATIHLTSGETIDAEPAWLLVGSPKYAPELVNITTLWDTAYDTAVRFLGAAPDIYDPQADTAAAFAPDGGYTPLAGFDPDHVVDFTTDVEPILERIADYRWVADVPYLSDVATPGFDVTDASDANRANRERFFRLFRVPVLPEHYDDVGPSFPNGPNQLFADSGIPLLPLNSGDNSVTNDGPIYKFETLSATQYFFLHQWAVGSFTVGEADRDDDLPTRLDRAGIGNCVGAPFSPGIETTWITRNAPIYAALARLKVAHFDGSNADLATYYADNGLSTTADEAEGLGCEPGDLTKRMAIPWQSDFQECTVQTPNITDPLVNQFADGTGIEVPPAYYVYWWPPQSPMHVVAGSLEPEDQVLDAVVSRIDGQPIIPAGQRVPYQRGIASVQDMLDSWSRLGFVVDRGPADMPYFVETERNSQALVQILLNEQAAGGS